MTSMNVRLASHQRPYSLPEPGAALELFKPVTWFPPMWAFGCGVASAGVSVGERWPLALLGVLVAGPLVCGSSQAVNDWFDRDVDAINEPDRPIPSGRLPGRWGLALAVASTFLAALVGWFLGPWGFGATMLALAMAWAYSAPPFRFKRNGWIGNAAVGFSYEGLAWVTGAAVMLSGAAPSGAVLILAALYSIGAHGIMTLNDFKSIRGDLEVGIRSVPAIHGPRRAAIIASVVMVVPQLAVVGFLLRIGSLGAALAVAVLVTVQLGMMVRFVRHPIERALWMSALGVPFYVSGMMISAFAIRGL
jgi:chlorophyll synthase